MEDNHRLALKLLYKIRLTTLEMMEDRGYVLNKEENEFLVNAIRDANKEINDRINKYIMKNRKDVKNFIEQIKKEIVLEQDKNFDKFANYYYEKSQKNGTVRRWMSRIYEHKSGKKKDRCLVYYVDVIKGNDNIQKDTIGTDEIKLMLEAMEIKEEREKVKNVVLISPKVLSQPAGEKVNNLTAYTIDFFLEKELVYNPTKHAYVPIHEALTPEESEKFKKEVKGDIIKFPKLLTTDRISRYYGYRKGQIIRIYNKPLTQSLYKTLAHKIISPPDSHK